VQDPGDVIPYLTSGQADVAVTYMPSLVMHDADVRVMGYLVKEPLVALIAREGLDLSSPCVIGCATDGIQTPLLRALLDRNASPDAQMMSVSFDLVSAFLSGQVDAIFGGYWNIETEHIRSQGQDSYYLTLPELGVPHHFELVLIGKTTSREVIGRFKEALQESIEWCREHPQKAFELYVSLNPDKTAASVAWEQRAWERTLPTLAHNQLDEQDVWHDYASWLYENRLLPTSVSLNHLFLD
jgi:NitT/TauT family transport system substrate-binding protein